MYLFYYILIKFNRVLMKNIDFTENLLYIEINKVESYEPLILFFQI